MALYLLKYPYRKILLPVAKKLLWVNPDVLSYLAVVAAFATMFCYLSAVATPGLLLVSIVLTLLRMTLNTLDGVIAIERGNLRLKGEIVNALPDRYSDIFILIGIGLSPLGNPVLGIIAISGVFLVSYTGMLGKAIGGSWQHQGPLGKVERLILIMICSLLQYLALTNKIGNLGDLSYFEWLLWLFIICSQITVIHRLTAQLHECQKLDWLKYRQLDKKVLVIYESMTGNTAKVANTVAEALACPIMKAQAALTQDLSTYDLIILATPELGHNFTTADMKKLLADKKQEIRQYALVFTSGMPIYRLWSTVKCTKFFSQNLNAKPLDIINIKGFHAICKTYKNRPNDDDLLKSYLFAIKLYSKIHKDTMKI